MIHAFKELGHEVETCIMGGEELNSIDINIESSSIKRTIKKLIPAFLWQTLKDFQLRKHDNYSAKVLQAKVDDFKPDLIYERGFYLMKSGTETAAKYGIKHVLEINGPILQEKKELEGRSAYFKKAKSIELGKLLSTDKIVVVSSALRDHFSVQFPETQGKYIITPNAIRMDNFRHSESGANRIKEELDLEDGITIGFVGSILPHHGVDILINAFKRVIYNHPDVNLLIVGDGETKEELVALAREKLAVHSFVFTGNVPSDEVQNYISAMDICVMPKSNWYGSPVKIFEYGAMGKPIIAPDRIPLHDVMVDGEDGIFTNESSKETELAINKLLSNAELRERLAMNFKKKVASEHLWTHRAKTVIDNL
jgi:glycosyltransferase involved in cell wall biosynthesis